MKQNAAAASAKINQNKRCVKPINDSHNLRVTKCRRTKNLVKKSLEISTQCQIDFVIIQYDKKLNKFKEIYTNPELTLDKVNTMLSQRDKSKSCKQNAPKYHRMLARKIVEIDEENVSEDEEPLDIQE